MKAHTDLKQSMKLARILPVESADMKFPYFGDGQYGRTAVFGEPIEFSGGKDFPCWSLAALIEVLPEFKIEKTKAEDGYGGYYYYVSYKNLIAVPYNKELIDGFVEMIVRLKNEDLL